MEEDETEIKVVYINKGGKNVRKKSPPMQF